MATKPQSDFWNDVAQSMCFKDEESMLRELYSTMSISDIAKKFQCGQATIQRRLSLYSIAKRSRGGAQVKSLARYKLWHIDQRYIIFTGLTVAARHLGVSTSALYNYKKAKTRL